LGAKVGELWSHGLPVPDGGGVHHFTGLAPLRPSHAS